MRHQKDKWQKLGLERSLGRGLVRALVEEGIIETSETNAKILKSSIDRLITVLRRNNLASRRLVVSRLGGDKETVRRLELILPKFGKRTSGFVRIMRLGTRLGDASLRVKVEWVDQVSEVAKGEAKTAKTTKKVKVTKVSTK